MTMLKIFSDWKRVYENFVLELYVNGKERGKGYLLVYS